MSNAYELMLKTNYRLILGENISDMEKRNITERLLAEKNTREQVLRFNAGMGFAGNADGGAGRMYPEFYIPPYNNGRKYRTILGQMPKTQILSANMYELEILRLLKIFAPDVPDAPEIDDMVCKTLVRLKNTCFGYQDDGKGECFDASLIVLRFLAAAAPNETMWIQSRIDNFKRHYDDKKRPRFCMWYYWLCLSELPLEIAESEIDMHKSAMLDWLRSKSCVINSDHDKTVHSVMLCILRNNISHYPEYRYIKDRFPYVNECDKCSNFDMIQQQTILS